MRYRFAFIYIFVINVYGKTDNNFIFNYFNYKKITNVIGFSCNTVEDDYSLLKYFNQKGILSTLNKLNNDTKISLLASTKYRSLGIFLDIRCYNLENIISIFLEASECRMFDVLHNWLILGSDLKYVLSLIDDSTFDLSTEFVIAVVSDVEDYQLYDTYNLMKERGTVLNVTFLGNWNEKSGLNISLKQNKFARRSNLHRLPLRAMFFKCTYKPADMSLEEYLDDYQNATKDARLKFGYQIIKHLGELYNFSLQYSETSKWQEGDTLGPLARALANKSADITGTPLNMNIERTYILKFVHEDWIFRTCFIFRNPQPTNIKAQIIFRPLEKEIWYLIIVLVILGILILTVVFSFEEIKHTILSFSNSFLVTIGALCQQGTDMRMKHISTRIAFLFIMIFGLLIYNYYSASVVSARLGQPIYKINDSLNEFSKLNLKMSSEWMVYLPYLFNMPNWEIKLFYHNHWRKLPESQRFMLPEEGIRLVQKGGFAYHTHPDISYPFIERLFDNREVCELMEVHLGRPSYTAFGVQYNSSYKELTRVGLTKISEVGLRHRQTTRWQYRKPQCRKDLLTASSITIYEFAPHLILLMIGMLSGIAGCILEILIANHSDYIKFKIIRIVKRLFIRKIEDKQIIYVDLLT